MKKIILFLCLGCLSFHTEAQTFLKTAGGTNGILFKNTFSSFNYNLADSKLALSLKFNSIGSVDVDKSDIYEELSKFADTFEGIEEIKKIRFYYFEEQTSFDIAVGAFEKGKLDLFSNNVFQPNLELSMTHHWTSFKTKNQRRLSFFIRPAMTLVRRKNLVNRTPNLFEVETKSAFDTTLGLGLNYRRTEDIIFAFTATAGLSWNADSNLSKKDYCVEELTGVNESGQAISVSSCQNLPFGELESFRFLELRADALWRSKILNTDQTSRVGLLGSFATVFSNNTPSYNFALGPAFFDKDNPGSILFSVSVEFLDFTKAFAATENFSDVFGIRAYIGVPFSKLGIKRNGKGKEREEAMSTND